jgi:hypothetical protein
VAVQAACRRLGLPAAVEQSVNLFSAQAHGFAVQLPGWRYPVVCNVTTGELKYDNFNGRWGDQEQLDRFLQSYAVEIAKLEARKRGHSVIEQPLDDGSIRLTVELTGGTT